MKITYTDVDTYISAFPSDVRKILVQVRRTILEAAPNAVEQISYNMPAYKLNGVLVYFAGYKKHIGFYPTPDGIEAFETELSSYKYSKGAVQFPIDKPIPFELISRIVKYRVKELSKVVKNFKD